MGEEMDSWNQENKNNDKKDQDVTVSGQFNSGGQQGSGAQNDNSTDSYGQSSQNGYGQFSNGYGQNSYGQSYNSYNQNSYGTNGYTQNGYGQNSYGQQQNAYGQSQNSAGGYSQPYANYNQQSYQGPGYSPVEKEEPIGIGEWAGLLALVSFVPCVGIILVIVWAFNKTEKKSKSNFCKAYLIIALIKLALAMILFIIYGAATASVIGDL